MASNAAGAQDKSQKKPHVHIAEATTSPEHTYVEKIHTPRRSSQVREDASEAEWDHLKHAHIDEDAASPAGLVDRVQTPIATPNDRGFANTVEEVELEVEEDERARTSEKRRRNAQSAIALVIGIAFGAAAVLIAHRRRV